MKKLFKKLVIVVTAVSLFTIQFNIIHPSATMKKNIPQNNFRTWPGNYNPKPGQEDGAYSFPGLYEPYYILTDYNYKQWISDYTKYSERINRARGECLADVLIPKTTKSIAGYAYDIKNIIKFGSRAIPWAGIFFSTVDYNICMSRKGF